MAKNISGLKPIQPGQTLNPGGRPVGARTRLTAHYLNALADDFAEHGKKAIVKCREERPDAYLKVVGALMPKQIEVTRPLEGLTDDELAAIAEQLRSQVGSLQGGAGTSVPGEHPAARAIPALSEAN